MKPQPVERLLACLLFLCAGASSAGDAGVSPTRPIRAAEVDRIDPFLSTPATGALYGIPVMIINYIPTKDGTNVDSAILGKSTIEDFKKKLLLFNKRAKFMLEEGSRYHGYKDSKARPSLRIKKC